MVVTLVPDGSDIRIAVPPHVWALGGNHPSWCPDGDNIIMNLNYHGKGLSFYQVLYDGSNFTLMTDIKATKGHPSLHPSGRYILTDEYPFEEGAADDGTSRILLIDRKKKKQYDIIRINASPTYIGKNKELRLDLHPSWDRQYQYIIFNAIYDNTRKVFVADLSSLLD